jgi:hypothetical protein
VSRSSSSFVDADLIIDDLDELTDLASAFGELDLRPVPGSADDRHMSLSCKSCRRLRRLT